MEKPNILPQIYTQFCPSSPTIAFKHSKTPNIPKRIRKIYQNNHFIRTPQRNATGSKMKNNPQSSFHLQGEEPKKEEIKLNRKDQRNEQKIPQLHKPMIKNKNIRISEFHHSKTKEEIRGNSKPLQNYEGKKNKIKSKPEILKKYGYSFSVQENDEEKIEGETLLPTPAFGSIKKKEKIQIKQEEEEQKMELQKEEFIPYNLPACEVKALIDHIFQERIYKEEDMKILKLRMIHNYGSIKVKKVWKIVIKLLEKA